MIPKRVSLVTVSTVSATVNALRRPSEHSGNDGSAGSTIPFLTFSPLLHIFVRCREEKIIMPEEKRFEISSEEEDIL